MDCFNVDEDVSPKALNQQPVKTSSWPTWCVKQTNLFIYSSHFLSSWGDHMWIFGSGLLLIEILPDSLQLTAIYGLSVGVAVLLFGTLVGDWVDRTPRLRAVQVSLVLQKAFLVLSVTTVYSYMVYRDSLDQPMEEWKRHLCYGVIILFAVLGSLAQVARVITIERDWIVEMCGGDKDMLASVTASMRRIDLITMVFAPIVTGQIMTEAGLKTGCLFIGAWNFLSIFVGYFLMWKVYQTVPALRKTKTLPVDSNTEDTDQALLPVQMLQSCEDQGVQDSGRQEIIVERNGISKSYEDYRGSIVRRKSDQGKSGNVRVGSKNRTGRKLLSRALYSITTLYRGMNIYRSYDVHRAGLAIACLYLTVLGFDGVTVGYIYTQGVSESVLGMLMGGAALVGIIGTIAYPATRRRFGIVRTGLLALGAHWVFISLCVISTFLPGSPFDPYHWTRNHDDLQYRANCSHSDVGTIGTSGIGVNLEQSLMSNNTVHVMGYGIPRYNDTGSPCLEPEPSSTSIISISVFMTGIIGARFGLWMLDLTITQLFLECVVEGERGKVNGVQTSLNMMMDMTKFAIVVALPVPPVFGFLAIISFCSVTMGDVLYVTFSKRSRGHSSHFGD